MTTRPAHELKAHPSTAEEMEREVFRGLYLLQNEFKEAENDYLRLLKKRRAAVKLAATLMPVTKVAKALRVSRQKVYQITSQAN